jgi:FKBP-type peptidyl-prolyl cis-trans isomerase
MNPARVFLSVFALTLTAAFPLMAQTALEKGEKFLAENGKRDGVKTTASGLEYEVITEGAGKSPKATDTVLVHYSGKLIDGKEFDSSYKRGEPIEFPLNQVIPGWTEGVQLMKEGAKYRFFIPSKLAYGKRGAGPDIGPDETLIFEVELLKVR